LQEAQFMVGLWIGAELDDLGPARPDNERGFMDGFIDISQSASL
jgi:hypothetical protein